MSDIPVAVQTSIARSKWCSDLLRLHAAELQRIVGDDQSPAAASIVADADKKVSEAELHELNATLVAELAAAKAASQADPKDERLHKRYEQVAQEITDARATWRGIGEAAGTRRGAATVDDFPEPSDEEVLASHGGNA